MLPSKLNEYISEVELCGYKFLNRVDGWNAVMCGEPMFHRGYADLQSAATAAHQKLFGKMQKVI